MQKYSTPLAVKEMQSIPSLPFRTAIIKNTQQMLVRMREKRPFIHC
jgi:hypothetical protein